MLVQRCTLDQHRAIIPISISKPVILNGTVQLNQMPQMRCKGLVDTGAQRTVLSRSIIGQAKLSRTGHMQFGSLHGTKTHSRYLATIGFWTARIESQTLPNEISEQSLFVHTDPIEIVDMDENQNFDAILGWDVLRSYSFSYDHKGQMFEISFG